MPEAPLIRMRFDEIDAVSLDDSVISGSRFALYEISEIVKDALIGKEYILTTATIRQWQASDWMNKKGGR